MGRVKVTHYLVLEAASGLAFLLEPGDMSIRRMDNREVKVGIKVCFGSVR